jgi:hypothetical protein
MPALKTKPRAPLRRSYPLALAAAAAETGHLKPGSLVQPSMLPRKCPPDVQIGIRADAASSIIDLVAMIRRRLRVNSRMDGTPFSLRRGGCSHRVPPVCPRLNVPNNLCAASFD